MELAIYGAQLQAGEVLEALESKYKVSSDINNYEITFMGNFIDKYGKEFRTSALHLEFNRETLNEINWENKGLINFEAIANRAVRHNAYR